MWYWESLQLNRIEGTMDRVLAMLNQVLVLQKAEDITDMATQAALDKLTQDVAANTDAVASAAAALNGYVATVTDLTTKLQAALDAAGVDDPTVLAAASAIEANNATLAASVPKVAQAVDANT